MRQVFSATAQRLAALALTLACGLAGDVANHADRGLERFKVHDFQGAQTEFEAALREGPDSPIVRVNLGWACYYAGHIPEAEKNFQAALAIRKRDPYAHFPLGVLAKARDRLKEALSHFGAVLEADPDDPATLYQIGQIEMRRGDYQAAAKRFRLSLEGEPESLSTIYNLARALIRLGEREEGRRLMARFQEMQRQSRTGLMGAMSEPALIHGKYAQLRRTEPPD